jgi:hypothetical protein
VVSARTVIVGIVKYIFDVALGKILSVCLSRGRESREGIVIGTDI